MITRILLALFLFSLNLHAAYRSNNPAKPHKFFVDNHTGIRHNGITIPGTTTVNFGETPVRAINYQTIMKFNQEQARPSNAQARTGSAQEKPKIFMVPQSNLAVKEWLDNFASSADWFQLCDNYKYSVIDDESFQLRFLAIISKQDYFKQRAELAEHIKYQKNLLTEITNFSFATADYANQHIDYLIKTCIYFVFNIRIESKYNNLHQEIFTITFASPIEENKAAIERAESQLGYMFVASNELSRQKISDEQLAQTAISARASAEEPARIPNKRSLSASDALIASKKQRLNDQLPPCNSILTSKGQQAEQTLWQQNRADAHHLLGACNQKINELEHRRRELMRQLAETDTCIRECYEDRKIYQEECDFCDSFLLPNEQ